MVEAARLTRVAYVFSKRGGLLSHIPALFQGPLDPFSPFTRAAALRRQRQILLSLRKTR